MGSWVIIHPDTLGYHAQTIKWIQDHKVVPGLVNIHVRYGYQGYWYIVCAIFGFGFTHTTALTFINLCVLCWYVLFVLNAINEGFTNQPGKYNKQLTALCCFFLLVMNFWDFGQLRLTAVSTSPDFISGIYVWSVFYVFLSKERGKNEVSSLMLTGFLSMIAVTMKLSTAPVLLLTCYVIYLLISMKKKQVIVCLIALSAFTYIPFVTRNIITSGYVVFPSVFPDLFRVDWKYDETLTVQEKQYITSYAKAGPLANRGAAAPAITEQVTSWLPVWWNNRTTAEKTMLGLLLITLVSGFVCIQKIIRRSSSEVLVLLCVSVTGLIFWFLQAPDPRFGYGFILAVQGLLLYHFAAGYSPDYRTVRHFLMAGILITTVIMAGYTWYRFTHYFSAGDLIRPEGIRPVAYRRITYKGIVFNVPDDTCNCGSTPLPCAYYNEPFSLRGKDLKEGFKPTKRPVR